MGKGDETKSSGAGNSGSPLRGANAGKSEPSLDHYLLGLGEVLTDAHTKASRIQLEKKIKDPALDLVIEKLGTTIGAINHRAQERKASGKFGKDE